MEEEFAFLASISELVPGKGHSFTVAGEDIAVFCVDGGFHAVTNICPHQHVPLIAEGELHGHVVTCPMHGWMYNIVTGEGVHGAGTIRIFETRVQDNALYIRIPKRRRDEWW